MGRSRARALAASGPLAARHGDIDKGRTQLDEAIRLWRDLVDRTELASALDALGWVLVYDAGDDSGSLDAFDFLADCELIRGDTEEAEKRYRESLRAALRLGEVLETSIEVQGVAMAVAANADPQRAVRLAGSVEPLWESLGTSISVAFWDELLD
jgi:hypothetical protein